MRKQVVSFLLAATCFGAELAPLPKFTKAQSDLQIIAPCVPRQPWTVAGEHGALFGRQNGKFEAWQWPIKLFSNFAIRAELADYPVPIDVNAIAAEIKVTPAETTITYSHPDFTVRQHMFAPRGQAPVPTGSAVVFEISSARPLEITFSFTPEMLRMWPAPNPGRPNGEWVKDANSGAYILHTDDPNFSAVVGMPGTRPGIMVPYQEHPQTFPLELKLSFDPKRDSGKEYPLLMALGSTEPALTQLAAINSAVPSLYRETLNNYRQLQARTLSIETPDPRLNEALRWAEVAIDQAQVKYHDETGLVAGYYESADSARPGYAWFFGRDTLWSTYAINSYGDFALTRRALDFILKRQRQDGKIMHEFSQSADALDWKSTPYFYAAADAAPLLVMAMGDYVRTSGDVEYLRSNWEAVKKAYHFTRAHESADGIFNNTQGTGWVESWPQGMPYQEVYLAALDVQSSRALSGLARLMGDETLAATARSKADAIAARIESEYYEPASNFYAFSRDKNGVKDSTASIYPSVAWWDGTFSLASPGPMLSRWASPEFSADWGTRDISNESPFYDPISYHQGSIWPLFTGWTSLAEYRSGRSLSGYAHLMQNVNLTWAQDLGAVTELLSGDYFQPLGRSSSHQLWSSAMVISPMLRGLFGLDWDASAHTLRIAPHLPATWDSAKLHNVPLGSARIDLAFHRQGDTLIVEGHTQDSTPFCLQAQATGAASCRGSKDQVVRIALPAVEIAIPANVPEQGATTLQLKVVDQSYADRQASFTFEAQGGRSYDLPLRLNRTRVTAKGASISNSSLHLQMGDGAGFQKQAVVFSW